MNLSIVIENDEDKRNIDELLEQINAKILFHPPKNSPYFEFKENKLRFFLDRKSTRLNSSHSQQSRMPSSA